MDLRKKLKHVAGSVWDMDGCVYPYPDNYGHHCNETAAIALFHIMGEALPDDFSEFTQQAKQSFLDTGNPIKHFSEKYKIDFQHFDGIYHQLLKVEEIIPEFEFSGVLRHVVGNGHRTHLATHSHEFFTSRALEVLGLSQIFQMNSNVITPTQYAFEHRKDNSPIMILNAFDTLGIDSSEGVFVEDTPQNFIPLKDGDHRVTTILICRGDLPDKKPSHVDFIVQNASTVIRALPHYIPQ